MVVDYYKILGVDRSAKDGDLKKAAEAKFKQISKAYHVLSDPEKRAVYDQYGEEGLKGQMPPPNARGRGGTTVPRSSDDPFAEFFGFSSPFGETGGMGSGGGGMGGMRGSSFSSSIFGNDIFSSFGEGAGGGGSASQSAPRKAPPIENRLPCSLEDLYKGTTKKMKISREIADVFGKTTQVEEILTIDIKPGWKKGTKITFTEKGNKKPNVTPADLVFIVDEKPHSLFERDGSDLIVTKTITPAEALTGYTVHLTTLDGRSLTIPINNVIHPDYEELVPKQGMPLQNDPTKKGNLRIKFNVKFPMRLTSEQKAGIRKLFAAS
ncbi:dnaJ homolog subfamily B member 4-like [Punica granatum]|uniref:DnaJ homolog subfamily B member 4-like n=1 Tax=Punica granatum TaxID=22663 RepID=A0A218Y1Z1_PUNGR|nr:dnaJ homolog subfamily B member 4-like [Punica granatum]OWM91078.1 hypothetical protein CDL15_Pgr023411 [Punica granatum]